MSLHFPGSWLHVLVVAGDENRARRMRDALRSERGEVSSARDGAEMRALLLEADGAGRIHPNVVLLDLRLSRTEWPGIARGVVEAGLTGPVVVLDWWDERTGEEGVGGEGPGDLSRLIRRAIIEKRTEDERIAAARAEATSTETAADEAERVLRSGGVQGPGCHAMVGPDRIHLTLREDTEPGLLAGLDAIAALSSLLARAEGRAPLHPDTSVDGFGGEPVVPDELIRSAVERYAGLAAAKGVRLLEIEEEYAPGITCDEPRLLSALGILTAFVLHLARPGGDVRVSAHLGRDDAVGFGVSFDGAGVAEEHLPLLADVFAAVTPIAERHGARLSFTSSWGRWFGFDLSLPPDLSGPAPL